MTDQVSQSLESGADSLEGFDTVALQEHEPELFDVIEKDGVQRWNLRPQVREALHRVSSENGI